MLTPNVLHVEHWAQFEKARLTLNEPGVCFVRGRNEDANGNPNGAGKSSLFNALYAMQFGDHQLAVRKNSLKGMSRETTRIAATYDNGSQHIVADMKAAHLRVKVDGAAVESRKKNDERNELLSLLGIGPELWSATVHLNGIASNPLLRGTSAARCAFIERAFNLDRWLGRHAMIGEIMSQMRRADTDLTDAKHELSKLGVSKPVEAGAIDKLVAKRKHLRTHLDLVQKAQTICENLPPRPNLTVEELQSLVDRLEKELQTVGEDADTWAEWRAAERTWSERHDALTADIKALKLELQHTPKHSVEALQAAIDKLTPTFVAVKQANEDAPRVQRWYAVAKAMAIEHGIQWRDLKHLRALSSGWVANLHAGNRTCPVCGNALKNAVDGKQLEQLGRLLDELPENIDVEAQPIEPLRDRLNGYAKQLRAAETYATARKLYDLAVTEYRQLVRPVKPKGDPARATSLPKQLADTRSLLDAAKRWRDVPQMASVGVEKLQVRSKRLRAALDEVEQELEELRAAERHDTETRRLRESLEARIEKLEREVELRPAYRALQVTYSPNGLRLWLLQDFLERIIENMNETSHSTRDRRLYGYKLSRNRELLLTASNRQGTYDIRLLSGAEASFYLLNLLTVILPMLPSSRRCSMLVLDEIDGNCSLQSRAIMASEYLPRLLPHASTIFVVTPSLPNAFKMVGSREIAVVKRNEVSRLEV